VFIDRVFRRLADRPRNIVMLVAAAVLVTASVLAYGRDGGAGDGGIAVSEAPGYGAAQPSEPAETPAGGGPESAAAPGEGGGGIAAADAAEAPALIVVDVSGAVNAPSVLIMAEGSRVYEAIASAGGLAPDADTVNINQAAPLSDGDRLFIPGRGESGAGSAPSYAPPAQTPPSVGTVQAVPGVTGAGEVGGAGDPSGLVNINTADSAGLQRLSGVGPSTAGKIIEYREKNGAFKTPEDLKKVSGIGEKTFEKLKDGITVG
jgi:competence protein ComEA